MLTLPVEFLAILGLSLLLNLKVLKPTNLFVLVSPFSRSCFTYQQSSSSLKTKSMIPALIILATLGLFFLQQKLFSQVFFVLAFVFSSVPLSLFFFTLSIHHHYQTKYSQSWQYGYQEAIEYLQNNQLNYDKVFVTRDWENTHIFYSLPNSTPVFFQTITISALINQTGTGPIKLQTSIF